MVKTAPKPYVGKVNTIPQAKTILNESIKNWEKSGESSKIIALGRYAEKWTGSPDKSDKERMKVIYTSINQTKAQIKRDGVLGSDTSADVAKVKHYQDMLSELEAVHGKYIPTKPKAKAIKSNVIE